MLPFWSLNSERTVKICTRDDPGRLWWRLLWKNCLGAMMKILKMSLEFIPVHFILCRLPLILLGQAEQCLLGVQVPEKSFWR